MAPMVSILTLIRNRDCLMCYLRHRMERIENMRWDVGDMPQVFSLRAPPTWIRPARTLLTLLEHASPHTTRCSGPLSPSRRGHRRTRPPT